MSNQKKKGMNLPNKLTVLRVMLVPVFIVVMMLPASTRTSLILMEKWSEFILDDIIHNVILLL